MVPITQEKIDRIQSKVQSSQHPRVCTPESRNGPGRDLDLKLKAGPGASSVLPTHGQTFQLPKISPTEFSGPLHPDHWRNAARRPDCQLSNRSRTWPWASSYKRQDPHLQALGMVPPKGKHALDPEFTPLTTFCMVHGV